MLFTFLNQPQTFFPSDFYLAKAQWCCRAGKGKKVKERFDDLKQLHVQHQTEAFPICRNHSFQNDTNLQFIRSHKYDSLLIKSATHILGCHFTKLVFWTAILTIDTMEEKHYS